jgi:ABC-type multidrug transport system ATPase subunit
LAEVSILAVAEQAPTLSGQVLSVRRLAKRFGQRPAVVDVSLDLAPAEVLGFVGPNGAGKTTTLRILAGLLRADSGEGQVLGHNIMASGGDHRKLVGYMPQKLALYGELSVAENLRFRAEVYEVPDPRRAVTAAIEDFDLGRFRGERASSLSGGWARRLQLAAALIHRPKLVLLDEPTAGLDAESRQDVWRRIAGLAARGDSVVINTHDLAEAEQCGRVALFSRGSVLALGDPHVLAETAPFKAVLIDGGDVHRAALHFDALEGVMATYVQGQRLRVLMRPDVLGKVRERARAAGLTAEDTPKRLEDAAFVLVRESLPDGPAS